MPRQVRIIEFEMPDIIIFPTEPKRKKKKKRRVKK